MFKKLFLFFTSLVLVLSASSFVYAGPDLDNTSVLGGGVGGLKSTGGIINKVNADSSATSNSRIFSTKNALDLFKNGITIVLGFFATIILAVIIYSGFKVITSNGKVDSYKDGIVLFRTAVIAMLIILLSYSISTFVLNTIKVLSK